MRKAQKKDETLKELFFKAKEEQSQYVMRKGLLYKHSIDRMGEPALLLVVPEELRRRVFVEAHSTHLAGYFGSRKTTKKITNLFCWPHITKDVVAWCRECEVCQRHNMGTTH